MVNMGSSTITMSHICVIGVSVSRSMDDIQGVLADCRQSIAWRLSLLQNERFIFFPVMPEVFLSGIQTVVVRPGSGFRLNTLPE